MREIFIFTHNIAFRLHNCSKCLTFIVYFVIILLVIQYHYKISTIFGDVDFMCFRRVCHHRIYGELLCDEFFAFHLRPDVFGQLCLMSFPLAPNVTALLLCSERMGNGLQSKTMSASLNTVVGGTDADFGRPYPSEDLQIADELNLNFDPKPDFKPELNIDAVNKLISTGMQNLTTAIIASNPESKNNLASLDQIFANFFLLYKQCFDFHR